MYASGDDPESSAARVVKGEANQLIIDTGLYT